MSGPGTQRRFIASRPPEFYYDPDPPVNVEGNFVVVHDPLCECSQVPIDPSEPTPILNGLIKDNPVLVADAFTGGTNGATDST